MSSHSPPKPTKAGLSLYASLLDPSNTTPASGTISRAPVVFSKPSGQDQAQDEAALQKQQISAAALRFQPTKRPQVPAPKAKGKPNVSKATASVAAALSAQVNATAAQQAAAGGGSRPAAPKTTFADWTAQGDDDDVNGFYGAGDQRQRGGRKKRKKNNKGEAPVPQNWDDIYDPSRPNSYEEYKNSDEKIREIREWKDRLYAHRMVQRKSNYSDSEDEERYQPQMNKNFAPPPSMSFAPPPELSAPAVVPDDPTGEDAYARRMRLSGLQQPPPPPSPPSYPDSPPPPPPEASRPPPPSVEEDFQQPPPPPPEPRKAPQPTSSISRAPVRYSLPAAPAELPNTQAELETALEAEAMQPHDEAPDEEEDAPRSLRPGQSGFAARLMSKYGWTKGSGLGASGSGIVNPLRVKVEKAKKKSDAEGGGFVGPKGGTGKIIGGPVKKGSGGGKEDEGGKFGVMSEVVVLRGMVDGMDLRREMEGGLVQEIGEECGEKYGMVERVFVEMGSGAVFVKFTSQLSGLRAVNALEGRIFNGNAISARFFDVEKFEKGEYD